MFIQTETTPNPSTLKFLPGRELMSSGTLEIRDAHTAERSPLAKRLFAVPGVSGVFYGQDFVSVTKSEGEWQHLKPALLGAIMEHFLSGDPLWSIRHRNSMPISRKMSFSNHRTRQRLKPSRNCSKPAFVRQWRVMGAILCFAVLKTALSISQ